MVRRAEAAGRGWRATLQITGQSHAIAVRAGGETLTQVLAPPGAPLPRCGLRASIQIARHGRDEILRVEGALHYRASFRAEMFAPADFRERAAALLSGDSMDRIKAFFDDDESGKPPELAAFALIDFRSRPRRLDVVAVHAYPHELAIVRVDARFDVAPHAPP